MSGHSKWSTIKHKKAATDAKRGKIFSKISCEIMIAVASGGGDPDANITLRALIQKGRAANMPMDNIDRAIKRGLGEGDQGQMFELSYEGYANGGIAVVVSAITDNKNRTAAEVKHAFTKFNASLAGAGAVSRMFNRVGQIVIEDEGIDEDELMDLVLEAGAEDMVHEDGIFDITTDPYELMVVVDALTAKGIEPRVSEVTRIPETTIPVTDKAAASQLLRFIETLEDLDDVQDVYSNYDIDDDLMAEIEAE